MLREPGQQRKLLSYSLVRNPWHPLQTDDARYGNQRCEDIIFNGKTEDKSAAADAIRDGYILKKGDGSFFVTVPCFTAEQKRRFDAIVEKHFAPLMPEYAEIVEGFVADYKKLFPKHLSDDVDRMCQNMFSNFYATIVSYAQKNGDFAMPSENCCCEVMLGR